MMGLQQVGRRADGLRQGRRRLALVHARRLLDHRRGRGQSRLKKHKTPRGVSTARGNSTEKKTETREGIVQSRILG